jgi:hypothetical protein
MEVAMRPVLALLALALCSIVAPALASSLDAGSPLDAPSRPTAPAEAPQPKIGPPVATGGAPACIATVFEKGQGCECPRGMQRDEIGDPAKIGAEHVMVWCRRKPGVRM